MVDLKMEVFDPVAKRIIERSDSLKVARKFSRSGIEGWLKVEAAAALNEKVLAFQNRGPDLLLEGNLQVELKAATDLNPAWIVKEGVLKYGCPCLFLGDGQQSKIDRIRTDARSILLAYEVFSDGQNPWVIGIIAPK